MMNINDILHTAIQKGASDIFLVAGRACSFKVNDQLVDWGEKKLMPAETATLIKAIYEYAPQDNYEIFLNQKDDDFSISIPNVGRFRVNVYMQRNSQAAVLRVVRFTLPDASKLGIPDTVLNLWKIKKGMILVSGPAGSGKSTTLACIIDQININRDVHIITLEDPIEYLHPHKNSIVSQREIFHDSKGYTQALRAAMREAPQVILIGEMRDVNTMDAATKAAETGHLVLSSLHTIGATNSISRIIDAFPTNQQDQIKVLLTMTLQAVVSEQLIPCIDGGMVAAFEIMLMTPAIRTIIREDKIHQLENAIIAGKDLGMVLMDDSLAELVKQHKITKENALIYASNYERLKKRIANI